MKIRKKVAVSLNNTFDELIHNIKLIPGNKFLSLAYKGESYIAMMKESGDFVLPHFQETIFLARLADALRDGGGLIIRQVVPSPSVQPTEVQETRFYGIGLGKKDWKPMSKEAIREAKCRDPKTGQISHPAPGVSFGEIQKVKI